MEKSETVSRLEKKINSGIWVLLVDLQEDSFLDMLCKRLQKHGVRRCEVWHCCTEKQGYDNTRLLARAEMEELLSLYRLYEFSDKVTVISETTQYGGLINYVKNGLFTPEEMVDAILYGNGDHGKEPSR